LLAPTRGTQYAGDLLQLRLKSFPVPPSVKTEVKTHPASVLDASSDIYITDPPYGDAVKYEEILEFFIAWLRKNPPPEFAGWVWDSRRTLAIKGDDEAFRQGMVAAYRRMAAQMPDNGLQVIMFTHQSGAIWADMANIVWAAGLQVTAAWYVVTETDSALRDGSHVKGTVLLVVRKRQGRQRITSDDLAWAIQAEVEAQVETLTGLNQQAKGLYRDENLFEDADLQMAGYAAALRALTRFAVIDGRDMTVEASRPRVRGQTTFVDDLIDFAVGVANQFLAPTGIVRNHWEKLAPAERFYLKLIEMEARGHKTLDNYQNFAKAFKVRDYRAFLASQRANAALLQSAVELGRTEMNEGSELYQTPLRAVLYALMELVKGVDGDEVLRHLAVNASGYFDPAQRGLLIELAGYLAGKLVSLRPEEASAARVLGELMRGQRL
jgi:putative DNA methylase